MAATTTVTTPALPIAGAGAPPTAAAWQTAFEAALPYREFLERHATPDQRSRWDAFHKQVSLTPAQQTLLGGFVRRMPVLVLAGAWCGDCVSQCPIFDHFAAASPAADGARLIDVRFLDRDARPDIAAHLKVCGGQRVPVAMFLSEDFTPILFYGSPPTARRPWPNSAKAAPAARCRSGPMPSRLSPPTGSTSLSGCS